jgi:hypothetical protein
MKNIIWIDENPLIGRLVENIGKAEGFKAYHLTDSHLDFSYLINDLNPEVIVIDEINFKKDGVVIESSLRTCSYKGFIAFIGNDPQNLKTHQCFSKPINPFEVIEILKKAGKS